MSEKLPVDEPRVLTTPRLVETTGTVRDPSAWPFRTAHLVSAH
jgi:hypothetical protein